MSGPVSIIVGGDQSTRSRPIVVALAVGGFLATFAGYALGVFSTSGEIFLVPFYAAIGGMIAGCWAGYCRRGLVAAWLVTYTPMLAFHAEEVLLGTRGQSYGELLAQLFQPAVLVVLGIQTMILGTTAFLIGFLLQMGVNVFGQNPESTLPWKSS